MTVKSQQESVGHVQDGITDLKSLRESRGLTLDDIFLATRISIRNLEAMESGNFRSLPPPVYSRAYFHAYAKMLDVDDGPFVVDYEKYLAASGQEFKATAEETPGSKFCFSKELIPQLVGIAVACVLAFLIFTYFNFHDTAVKIEPPMPASVQTPPPTDTQGIAPPINPPATVATASQKSGSPQDEALPGAPADRLPPAGPKEEAKAQPDSIYPQKPSVLVITAQEETWLRIKEDDAAAYQLVLHPGERIARSGLRYTIDIGNAGGVNIEFQGKAMPNLGKSGQVLHLQLP